MISGRESEIVMLVHFLFLRGLALIILELDRSTPFTVRVYTGVDPGAGTDSNVFIELFGENISSGLIPLKTSLDQEGHRVINKFEAGCVDTFTVKSMDIGPLKKIRLVAFRKD